MCQHCETRDMLWPHSVIDGDQPIVTPYLVAVCQTF